MKTDYLIEKIVKSKIELYELLRSIKPIKTLKEEKEENQNDYENFPAEEYTEEEKSLMPKLEDVKDEFDDYFYYEEIQKEVLENKLSASFNKLYNQIQVLVELCNLNNYRIHVENVLGKYREEPIKILRTNKFEIYNFNKNSEVYQIIKEIDEILSPFDFSISNELEELKKARGIEYLENVLKDTTAIISRLKLKPNSEAKVYNAVKFVIHSVFPSSKSPSKNFLGALKNYEPDILIPELEAAIEYKYAETEEKIKSTISQIPDDVIGYEFDADYKYFYAVFFITGEAKSMGVNKFNEAIKERNFPKNWKFIYSIG